MRQVRNSIFAMLLLCMAASAQQQDTRASGQQPQPPPDKTVLDVGLRWLQISGDRFSSRTQITLKDSNGNVVATTTNKAPMLLLPKTLPLAIYTLSVIAPDMEDYPAVSFTTDLSLGAGSGFVPDNYHIIIIFDLSGKHGKLSAGTVASF